MATVTGADKLVVSSASLEWVTAGMSDPDRIKVHAMVQYAVDQGWRRLRICARQEELDCMVLDTGEALIFSSARLAGIPADIEQRPYLQRLPGPEGGAWPGDILDTAVILEKSSRARARDDDKEPSRWDVLEVR